jgi:hypothetical protein
VMPPAPAPRAGGRTGAGVGVGAAAAAAVSSLASADVAIQGTLHTAVVAFASSTVVVVVHAMLATPPLAVPVVALASVAVFVICKATRGSLRGGCLQIGRRWGCVGLTGCGGYRGVRVGKAW